MSRGEVNARKSTVTMHVVASLDGFIANKDNSISWMDSPGDVYERGVSEENADDVTSIDCFVLGSRTYEHALELGWPCPNSAAALYVKFLQYGSSWPEQNEHG